MSKKSWPTTPEERVRTQAGIEGVCLFYYPSDLDDERRGLRIMLDADTIDMQRTKRGVARAVIAEVEKALRELEKNKASR